MPVSRNFLILFAVGLVCGSVNSIALKICYQAGFEKPWFMSFVMFASMFLTIPAYLILSVYKRLSRTKRFGANLADGGGDPSKAVVSEVDVYIALDGHSPAEEVEKHRDGKSWARSLRLFFIILVPSVCDLLGTSLQQMGLCVTSVSVFQMLKGSILLFSALLSVYCLGRRLNAHNWIGKIGLRFSDSDRSSCFRCINFRTICRFFVQNIVPPHRYRDVSDSSESGRSLQRPRSTV